MRVRPVVTPALGWVLAPFVFVVLTSGLCAAGALSRRTARSGHSGSAADLGMAVAASLERGDDRVALRDWQQLCDTPVKLGGESAETSAEAAILLAGKTMAARGGPWRNRCAVLARCVAQSPGKSEGAKEVARRLMRLATSPDAPQPRTAAAIASASIP